MKNLLPDTAPFNEQQKAWLNGFFAGLMGIRDSLPNEARENLAAALNLSASSTISVDESGLSSTDVDSMPWHDANVSIDQRLEMTKDKPLSIKLMAAMAQLDCGSCGYLCQTYGQAIADGTEKNLTLCSPGGKETKQTIKLLLKEAEASGPSADTPASSTKSPDKNGHTTNGYNRQNPFAARLLESKKLNRDGSEKDVRHVILDLDGSGLKYHVGDAVGVFPENCKQLVSSIIAALNTDPQTPVRTKNGELASLEFALSTEYCLRDPSDELLELLASRSGNSTASESLRKMIEDGTEDGFDVLDALELAAPIRLSATEFVETLQPLNPRLYSIASSMQAVGEKVHLTVGRVHFVRGNRLRKGVASNMLADPELLSRSVKVFVQPNHGGFTIPADDSAPMIMIGPGTGIAPFRAFLQERHARGASGANWLFFGDQRQATDFLYQEELLDWHQSDFLTRLDTAFSRDGDRKVYVQDRMLQNADELWKWVQQGAYIYVCGDAKRMAADVDATLHRIVMEQGKLPDDAAKEFLQSLRKSNRYVRDVY